MKSYFKHTLKSLDKVNIKYFIGADSLVGLGEGNLFKYSHNLKIYICEYNFIKISILFFILLKKKIVLKPKIENGTLLFKIRYKPNLTTKNKTWIKCFVMRKNKQNYYVSIGNKKSHFEFEDIKIKKQNINGDSFNVPAKMKTFISKYKNELLFDFYRDYGIDFNSNEEKKVVQFLFDVEKNLKELSIDYWIEGGTLLGAVRDQKLIPWDHDIDMGMINKSDDTIKKVIKKLKKEFYVSVKSFDKTEGVWELGKYRVLKIYPKKYFLFKDKLCLDIFIYYLGNIPNLKDKVYKYVVWGKNAYHKRKFFDDLQQIEFYGKLINVPSDYEEFLEVKYGTDWRTPKKKWNVALNDGSVIKG